MPKETKDTVERKGTVETNKTESDYAEFDKGEIERIKKSKGGKK